MVEVNSRYQSVAAAELSCCSALRALSAAASVAFSSLMASRRDDWSSETLRRRRSAVPAAACGSPGGAGRGGGDPLGNSPVGVPDTAPIASPISPGSHDDPPPPPLARRGHSGGDDSGAGVGRDRRRLSQRACRLLSPDAGERDRSPPPR